MQGKDLHGTLSKDYIPFGAGATLCVGSEFAKCIIAVFLHHLSRFRLSNLLVAILFIRFLYLIFFYIYFWVRWSLDPKTRVLRRYMLMFPAGCKVEIAKELSDQSWFSPHICLFFFSYLLQEAGCHIPIDASCIIIWHCLYDYLMFVTYEPLAIYCQKFGHSL